jgi:Beta-propeller repeat
MKINLCLLASLVCGIAAAGAPNSVHLLQTSPLRFEPSSNPAGSRFVATGLRYRFEFEGSRAFYRAGGKTVAVHFAGANPAARIRPAERLRFTANAFLGNNPAKWRTGIPEFGRLRVPDLYAGVDLVYYGSANTLEYDLLVRPGADPARIRLEFTGGNARIDRDGSLIAGFIEKRPLAYQIDADGSRRIVASRYRRNNDGSFGFALGSYDRTRELVIDPTLTFSAYLGGSEGDLARCVGHDAKGLIYVAGSTYSPDFAMVGNSENTTSAPLDAFIAIIDPSQPVGSQIIYTTYLGGSEDDALYGMTVGPTGLVYVTGQTTSTDFPTANGAQTALSGTSDAFVAVIDPSQSGIAGLYYATYLGGTSDEVGTSIALDPTGKIFVTGSTTSTDFPVNGGPQATFGGGQDVFVAEYDSAQAPSASLVYSTYLGGADWDIPGAIAVASDSSVWVTGGTVSGDFPTTSNGYQQSNFGGENIFVTRLDPALGSSGLTYSTYIGNAGNAQAASAIAIDASGRPVIGGFTTDPDFPVTANAMQGAMAGDTDAVVVILDPTKAPAQQIVYSTFFGGSDGDGIYGLTMDSAGYIYATGFTFSTDMPVTADAVQPTFGGGYDGFLLKFKPSQAGSGAIAYSSYLQSDGAQIGYGIDVAPGGTVYVVGIASGDLLGTMGGVAKTSPPGNSDGFVAAFNIGGSIAASEPPVNHGRSRIR